MKSHWRIALGLGLVLAPVALAAPALAAQEEEARIYTFGFGRGRIGVMVDVKADPARDSIGARVQSVIPEGPAQKAGLEAGDIIVKFNGRPLGGVVADDTEHSGPGMLLVELARELEPGDEVEVVYRRGGTTKTVTVTTERLGNDFVFRGPEGEGFGRRHRVEIAPYMDMIRPHLDFVPENFDFQFGPMGRGLELAELNEDLASYFGTAEGVLVMRAPRDTSLALKGGDVIKSIGGRAVQSPSHARRILSSYDEGETATIVILRQKRERTISWVVPERSGTWHFRSPSRYEVKPKNGKKESEA